MLLSSGNGVLRIAATSVPSFRSNTPASNNFSNTAL
jgi:hypothetical protein